MADLRSRAATILSVVERVEARSPVTVQEYRARLEAKMREVAAPMMKNEYGRYLLRVIDEVKQRGDCNLD